MSNNVDNTLSPDDTHEVELLKRSLSKLSFASTGFSKELDNELRRLRKDINANKSVQEITQQVEIITELVKNLDDNLTKSSLESTLDGTMTFSILSKDLTNPIVKLLKKQNLDQPEIPLLSHLEKLNKILKELSEHEDKPDKKGLFSWLNKNKDQSADTISTLPNEMRLALLQTLKQLELPERYTSQAGIIENKLNQEMPLNDLSEIIDQLSHIVIEISHEDQAKFQAFLIELNSKLTQVQEYLSLTTSLNKNAKQVNESFNNCFHQEVESLKTEVNRSNSLVELKSQIDFRLSNLLGAFNEFQVQQLGNLQKSESYILHLQQKLKETEAEMNKLKEDVIEQRMLAQLDALTSLPNRQMYSERIEQEYNRWRRYRGSTSLVICDIDSFKQINDNYGHLAGDMVLKNVASFLRQGLRESDFLARYGGEEFVIIMPETNLVDATKAVNKLRQNLQKLSTDAEDQIIAVTASFGVAEFSVEDTTSDVFTRADRALYRAKNKGRNMVCCDLHPDLKRSED